MSCCRFKSWSDDNSKKYFLFHCGARRLTFCLQMLSAVFILSVSLSVVLIPNDVISPAMKGLAMSFTAQVNPPPDDGAEDVLAGF